MDKEEKEYFDKLMAKHEEADKKYFEVLSKNIVLELKSEITAANTGLGIRIDKDISELKQSLALHNQEGKHNTEGVIANRENFEYIRKKVQVHKEEGKLQDTKQNEKLIALDSKVKTHKKESDKSFALTWKINFGIMMAIVLSALSILILRLKGVI